MNEGATKIGARPYSVRLKPARKLGFRLGGKPAAFAHTFGDDLVPQHGDGGGERSADGLGQGDASWAHDADAAGRAARGGAGEVPTFSSEPLQFEEEGVEHEQKGEGGHRPLHVRLLRGATASNPVVQIYDKPEGRLLSTVLMQDLISPYVTPAFRKLVFEGLASSYPPAEKAHPIPHRPDMHGFRGSLERALGATVRSRMRAPTQVSARTNDLLRGALRMREDAAKVNVPFVESMRPARRRQSPYSARRIPFVARAPPAHVAAARNSSAGGGFSSAASAAPSVGNSSAAIGAAFLRRHFGQGPTTSLAQLPQGSPPRAQSSLAASGAPTTGTASFTERPRRKCRCAAGSRWPTNR